MLTLLIYLKLYIFVICQPYHHQDWSFDYYSCAKSTEGYGKYGLHSIGGYWKKVCEFNRYGTCSDGSGDTSHTTPNLIDPIHCQSIKCWLIFNRAFINQMQLKIISAYFAILMLIVKFIMH